MPLEQMHTSRDDENSWLTVSSSGSCSSASDFHTVEQANADQVNVKNEDANLDDTLPVGLLDFENQDVVHNDHVLKARAIMHNSCAHNHPIGRRENVLGYDLKLPESSADFQPVCCSSRLISVGNVPSNTTEFKPEFCSTRFYSCVESDGASSEKQKHSSIASDFNPPFSSTQQGFCSCNSPVSLFKQRLMRSSKSDISELRHSPVCSTRISRRKGRLESDSSDFNPSACNIHKCKVLPLKRLSSNLQMCQKSNFSNFKPEFYSTASLSSSFLPLRCSTAVSDSHVFNPLISSTAAFDSSNISELKKLKLDSRSDKTYTIK